MIPHLRSWLRWLVALFAGFGVVLPMIIMVLVVPEKDQVASTAKGNITTVSLAVFIYCTILAWLFQSTHQEMVMAVASYAAVLVVFVGTQTSNISTVDIYGSNNTVVGGVYGDITN
jgi:hypothetical protein